MKNETIKTGTILYSTWGYDQTNVCFYVVTKVSGTMATVQRVKGRMVESGDMCGKLVPGETPTGSPIRRKIKNNSIKVDSCEWATIWHGRAVSYTAYA
jgi:hypothetical protein